MTDLVDQTLAEWRQSTFEYGSRDCLLSIADYIVSAGGRDGGEGLRGTYDDETGATALLEAHGGAAALIDRTGLPCVDAPGRGDVVLLDCGDHQIGAICTGPGVVARRERGTAEIALRFVKVVKAWKI